MKDNSIVILRVFATICIVLLHCFCYTIGGWGFFGKTVNANMPQVYFYSSELGTLGLFGFTFISGLLFSKLYYEYNKYHDPVKTIKNKFYRLLIPYFFWGGVNILLFHKAFSWIRLIDGVAHLWYLLMLFILFVIVAVFSKLLEKINKWFLSFLLLIGLYAIAIYFGHIGHGLFTVRDVVYYFPSFMTGYFYSKYKIGTHLDSKLSLLGFIIMAFLFIANTIDIIDIERLKPLFMPLMYMFAYISLSKVDLAYVASKIVPLDKTSMGVYIFHHMYIWIFLYYSETIRVLISDHYIISPFILFVIIYTLSYYSTVLFNKKKYTRVLLGG